MKAQIRLDTMREINEFVRITSAIAAPVYITDGAGLCVSAKSMMGLIYALEFEEIWCECEEDIYHRIEKFVI